MSLADPLPALLGGPAVRPQGPPSWPLPDENVLAALRAAFADGSWGRYHGGLVARLEERLAHFHAVEFAATCASGTFAVEVALRALQIGPGDEVILAAYDYPGNFLNVHAVGAQPVLVDVNAKNGSLDPSRLEAAVSPATRALIVSHLHGGVAPMREIMDSAAAHGLRVIEDAAQAPGAIVQGRRAGTWGDVGILSFGGSKLLSAGRGGAYLTRHADVHQRARLFLHRGNHICPLSELQAAALLPQLDKLDARNALRAAGVARLTRKLEDIPGLKPFANPDIKAQPGYYKLGFHLDATRFGLERARFVEAVQAEGIAFDEGFRALHVGRSARRWRKAGDLAEAEKMHHDVIVLHHPVLLVNDADIDEVAAAVRKTYDNRLRLSQTP